MTHPRKINEYGEHIFNCRYCNKHVIAYGHKANQRLHCSTSCVKAERTAHTKTLKSKPNS